MNDNEYVTIKDLVTLYGSTRQTFQARAKRLGIKPVVVIGRTGLYTQEQAAALAPKRVVKDAE